MLTVASFLAENARPVYERIGEWLALQVGEPAAFCRDDWAERHRRLDAGEVHVAFICGLPYSEKFDQPQRPVELLAAPVMAGARYGGGPSTSPTPSSGTTAQCGSFADLRGRAWVFNDDGSNSGYVMPRDHLLRLGETRGYFARTVASG